MTVPLATLPADPPQTEAEIAARVETLLSSMSLEQKIGQMLMVGLAGSTYDDLVAHNVNSLNVGGFIFLEQNGVSPEQVTSFTSELQRAALQAGGCPVNREGHLIE